MAASAVDPAWTYGPPMEPIPEEDDFEGIGSTTNVSRASQHSQQQSPAKLPHLQLQQQHHRQQQQQQHDKNLIDVDGMKRTLEQKQRTREIYTSEQVDTLKH
uniref:Uncharacterized protein n=1 Tax=Panagrolaimus sp. PS1159 TaxID=55785 RepID=A0AC35FYV1_9BILA